MDFSVLQNGVSLPTAVLRGLLEIYILCTTTPRPALGPSTLGSTWRFNPWGFWCTLNFVNYWVPLKVTAKIISSLNHLFICFLLIALPNSKTPPTQLLSELGGHLSCWLGVLWVNVQIQLLAESCAVVCRTVGRRLNEWVRIAHLVILWHPVQGHSIAMLVTFGAQWFFVAMVAVLCIVGCWAASLTSTH